VLSRDQGLESEYLDLRYRVYSLGFLNYSLGLRVQGGPPVDTSSQDVRPYHKTRRTPARVQGLGSKV
jgi:hypothetical protein